MAMPQLSGLNQDDPNYVSLLDQGVRTLRDLINAQLEKLGSLDENFHSRTIQELRRIDGIDVKEMPPVSNETKVGREVAQSTSLEQTLIGAHDLKASRQMEDVTRRLSRQREDSLRVIDDALTPLKRECQDFYLAIYALTKVKPLTKIDPKNPLYQAFVPFRDGVYVVTLNTATLEVSLKPHPNLTRKELEDASKSRLKMINLRRRLKGESYEGNLYVVTNPSSEGINSRFLTDYVGLKISREALLKSEAHKGKEDLVNFAMDSGQGLFTGSIAPPTYAQQTRSVR